MILETAKKMKYIGLRQWFEGGSLYDTEQKKKYFQQKQESFSFHILGATVTR